MRTLRLKIGGMTCVQCQQKIQKTLLRHKGVIEAEVNFQKSYAQIKYNSEMTNEERIKEVILVSGYEVLIDEKKRKGKLNDTIDILITIALIYFVIQRFGLLNLLSPNKLATVGMNFGMLFVVGIFTSVHCIAMCGGINLSQNIQIETNVNTNNNTISSSKRKISIRPAILYNLGRVISYTLVGFIVGGVGSIIDFSLTLQGVIKIFVGIVMIAMGMNLLEIFPVFRKFVPKIPGLGKLIDKIKGKSKSGPLVVGLLNGLMPCGPLQAMQLYALSTGSPLKGAIAMFMFSLGTVPLMFILSVTSAFMSKTFAKKAVSFGAMLIVVMGLSMFSQGIALSGLNINSFAQSEDSQVFEVDQSKAPQIVKSVLNARQYPDITVAAGSPVIWEIEAPEGTVSSCNNKFYLREYNQEIVLKTGTNTITFYPDKTGVYKYSCWMGMVSGTLRVVEPNSDVVIGDTTPIPEAPKPAGVIIPSDQIGISTFSTTEENKLYQEVKITVTDEGYSPAVVVVQKNIETRWTIDNQTTSSEDIELRVPKYATILRIKPGENLLMLNPDEDFEFTDFGSEFFGIVKVVEDIESLNLEKIKQEVSSFETLIYSEETYVAPSGSSCH